MVYFVIAEIKFDLTITGTVFDDAITTNWGPKSDEDVDNRIAEVVDKQRRRLVLPDLPLPTADITPTIRSASNHFVKMRYYQRIKQAEKQAEEEKAANLDIDAFVRRLDVDKEFYIRIAR